MRAVATPAPTGVDLAGVMALAHASGTTASLFSTLAATTNNYCVLYGTKGQLHLTGRFHAPGGLKIHRPKQAPEVIPYSKIGLGYHYEGAHVQECLAQVAESPLLPLAFSLDLMRTLDAVRAQIDLRYPGE